MSSFMRKDASGSGSNALQHDDDTRRPAESTSTENELWSSILDSVAGSKGIVTRNCIVLGNAKSGKSTLVSRIATRNGESSRGATSTSARGPSASLDLGLSYTVLDIHDEADEETIARLGVYQLPSSRPPYPSLLSLALSPETLLDSIVLIVLDWDRPWTFLRDLEAWIQVLDELVNDKGVGTSEQAGKARSDLESLFRHYVEPSPSGTSASAPNVTSVVDSDVPLQSGALTDNFGLSIVFVCTKSDQIAGLERERKLKEEQFDYVQQVLRTVALKYGAAVFSTSQTQPDSFVKLRAYVLHRLFAQPSSTSSSGSAAASRTFAFPHRANVVDKDKVMVPSGWDSWGKIKVLRERFDPEALSTAWDADLDDARNRRRAAKEGGTGEADANEDEGEDGARRRLSAVREYEEVVVNLEPRSQPARFDDTLVTVEDEQVFLKRHYDALQKEREKDPRAAFATRGGTSGLSRDGAFDRASGPTASRSSIVGPMSSYELSSVERTLSARADAVGASVEAGASGGPGSSAADDVSARLAKMMHKDLSGPASVGAGAGSTAGAQARTGSTGLGGSASGTSSRAAGSTTAAGSATGGAGQNEVLANFFQSLLAARGTGSTPRPLSSSTGASGASPATTAAPVAASSTKPSAATAADSKTDSGRTVPIGEDGQR